MALSNDLIKEFASVMNDTGSKRPDTTCYATVLRMESATKGYIRLDGAETETPASFTVAAHVSDRVLVVLKNRSALVIGNITHPVIMTGMLYASDGIVVEGYLTTNANRTRYDDMNVNGLTFSSGGIGAYNNTKSWLLRNDGTFQFGGAAGITYDGSTITLGDNVELLANRIKGTKSLTNDWGINFTTGELTVGTITADRLRGSKTFNSSTDWSIDFTSGSMSIGNITANKIVGGTLTLGGSSNASGVLSMKDASGNPIGGWSNTGISATKGSIGGWTIDNGGISKAVELTETVNNVSVTVTYTPYMQSAATYGANSTAFGVVRTVGSSNTTPFYVTYDGRLVATKATITGSITAQTGSIAGWTIGTSKITKGTLGVNDSIQLGTDDLGSATIAGKPQSTWRLGIGSGFGVDKNGALYATGATINGVLTAGSGSTIGPWTVSSTSIYNASGMYFGDNGLSVTDKFKVSSVGVLTATSASIKGTITATSLTATETITVTKSGQSNATLKYAVGTVSNGSGYGWDSSDGWINGGGVIPSGTTSNFTLSVPLYVNGRVEVNGRLQANGDLDIGSHSFTGRYIYSDYIYATGLRVGSPTGEPQVWAHITGANTKIYMYVNADGRRGLYSTTRGGTSHSILSFADNSTTGTFYGNCSGSSGSCTGHAASDLALTGGTITGNLTVNGTITGSLKGNVTGNCSGSSGSCTGQIKNVEGNSYYGIVTSSTDKQRIATIRCSTDTTGRIIVRGQFNSTTYSTRYFDTSPTSSDIRLKTNIEYSSVSALPIINAIKIRSFDWKEDMRHQRIGMIADELEILDPMFTVGGGCEEDGSINVKAVNSFYLQGYIIKAIQELTSRVKELEKKLKGAKN